MSVNYADALSTQQEGAAARLPFVSVIMPVRNEEKYIRQSLGAVLAQDYPRELMEVIVADGCSTDRTREILQEIQAQDDRVRIVENPGRIMPKGFNAGLKQSRAEIIVMMGGHAEISPNYISVCVRLLREGRAECVGGTLETVSETQGGEAISLALSSRFGVGSVAFRLGTTEPRLVDTVAFGAYRRDVITRAGMLDEEFVRNQDDEFNHRLRRLGARILLAPEIYSRYHNRSSLRALWRQYFLYGLWKVRVLQKHPRQMQVRHFVPALFVSALGVAVLIAPLAEVAQWAVLMLCAAYLAANLAASVQTAVSARKMLLLPRLPLVFATLHFAYGIGFLRGLIRFRRCWRTPSSAASVEYERLNY